MKKMFSIILVLGVLSAGGYYYWKKVVIYQKEAVPEAVSIATIAQNDFSDSVPFHERKEPEIAPNDGTEDIPETVESETTLNVPNELNLEVPFYAQAPFGDWDYPWQEACEEASVLLVANAYYDHNWTKEEFRDEILKLVDWEMDTFGAYEHTDVAQTERIINDYLRLRTVLHENPTLDDLKKIVARGHLAVMTFSGKELGNPFYTNGGPIYHAMVLKGYKDIDRLIFHDVGTRRGEDYVYPWSVIETSMRDYAEPIANGGKRVIEVLPPPQPGNDEVPNKITD